MNVYCRVGYTINPIHTFVRFSRPGATARTVTAIVMLICLAIALVETGNFLIDHANFIPLLNVLASWSVINLMDFYFVPSWRP